MLSTSSFVCQIRWFSSKTSNILSKNIVFQTHNGRNIQLNAVYEDSLPNGPSTGTVVAFHGAPGSHKDFKYIREKLDQMSIRFIGVNYPGFKQTDGYKGQRFMNEERQNYSNALLDELDLKGKIIYMGHSRGAENALMTATTRKSHGLVMINPLGLRTHKGSRPEGYLDTVSYIHAKLPKAIGDTILYKVYKAIGFKVQDGKEAINSVRAIMESAIEKQLVFIEKLNELKTTSSFLLFGGRDHLIEDEIIFEALESYDGLKHFSYDNDINTDEQKKIMQSFKTEKGASVFVRNDNHFQNKKRADLVASAVGAILAKPLTQSAA